MKQRFIDVIGAEFGSSEQLPEGRTGDLLLESESVVPTALTDQVLISAAAIGNRIPGQLDSTYRLPEVAPADAAALSALGAEAIACYLSFHYRRRRWGIYLSRRRLEAFTAEAFGGTPGFSDAERFDFALKFVLDHELFHYWTDVAATQMEFAAKRPVYVPYSFGHSAGSSPLAQLEEALANARALRNLSDPVLREAAEAYMKGQPPGYRDWHMYATPRRLSNGKRSLGTGIQGVALPAWSGELPFEWFFDERRVGARAEKVPLYWLDEPSRGSAFLSYHNRPLRIVESARVASELDRLPAEVGIKWRDKTRGRLESGNWSGTKFEKLKGGSDLYRCRVDLSHRVHLRRIGPDSFEALTVGTREAM